MQDFYVHGSAAEQEKIASLNVMHKHNTHAHEVGSAPYLLHFPV
jgi:hypothetical protein